MAIIRKLVVVDPNNANWRRRLSLSLESIGSSLLAAGDRTRALAAYEEALEIMRELAAYDPEHTGWQSGLSVSLEKVGDVRSTPAILPEHLPFTKRASPSGASSPLPYPKTMLSAQLALVIGLYNVSTVAAPPQRRAALSEALAIAERLAQLGSATRRAAGPGSKIVSRVCYPPSRPKQSERVRVDFISSSWSLWSWLSVRFGASS